MVGARASVAVGQVMDEGGSTGVSVRGFLVSSFAEVKIGRYRNHSGDIPVRGPVPTPNGSMVCNPTKNIMSGPMPPMGRGRPMDRA